MSSDNPANSGSPLWVGMSVNLPDATGIEDRKGYVKYGEENTYPDYLYEVYRASATHHALCNGIADMAYGQGVEADTEDIVAKARVQGILARSEKYSDGRNLVRKLFRDLKVYGRAYFEVKMIAGSDAPSAIYHVPFRHVRVGVRNEDGEIEEVYVTRDWSSRKQKDKPTPIPVWQAGQSGVVIVDLFGSEDSYYPPPDYIGALGYAALEMQVAEFHLANIENGLFPSFHIHHNNGIPGERERTEIRTEYERRMAGAGNAGAFILTWSDGTDRATELTPIPVNDADKQYQFLSSEATRKILIGHRVTSPLLFGIRDTGGGLGSNTDEMTTAMDLMEQNVLQVYREAVCHALSDVLGIRVAPIKKGDGDASVTDPKTLEAQAGLKGSVGGVAGIIDLVTQVTAGIIPASAAIVVLQELYGFDYDTAAAALGTAGQNDAAAVAMSAEDSREVIDDRMAAEALDYLRSKAQPIDELLEDYRVIDEQFVDDVPDADDAILKTYAFAIDGRPSDSSTFDGGFYRIRYQYRPGQGQPDIIATSRTYCKTMMSEFRETVFRKEDIDRMSFSRANPEFARKGAYSIWRFKGSFNCRHRWKRLVFFLKRVPAGQSVTVNGKTYKGGQFLPATDIEHYRILSPSDKMYGPRPQPDDAQATTVNTPVN